MTSFQNGTTIRSIYRFVFEKQIHYQVIITYRLTVNLLEYFLTNDSHLTFVRCNQNHELLVLTKYIMRINNL